MFRAKHARVHMLDTEPFEKTFGKKAQRKRPNIKVPDLEAMAKSKYFFLFNII